ncbi:hypothetical protein B0H13DRAFT_2652257 [Mycena leptocephala]|nr:hypothetical protein B0H13DRAFT_2652257 [Mycena leptocephala]
MGTLAVPPGDPFKDHLLAVLSLHDPPPPRAAAAPVPRYSGPRDWQTDAILRKVEALLSGRRATGTSQTSILKNVNGASTPAAASASGGGSKRPPTPTPTLGGLPANTVSFSAYPNNTTNNNNGHSGTPDSDTSYDTALSSHDAAREDEDDFSEYTTNGAYTDSGDGFGTINGAVASYDLCAGAYIFSMTPTQFIRCRSC